MTVDIKCDDPKTGPDIFTICNAATVELVRRQDGSFSLLFDGGEIAILPVSSMSVCARLLLLPPCASTGD